MSGNLDTFEFMAGNDPLVSRVTGNVSVVGERTDEQDKMIQAMFGLIACQSQLLLLIPGYHDRVVEWCRSAPKVDGSTSDYQPATKTAIVVCMECGQEEQVDQLGKYCRGCGLKIKGVI